LGTVFPAIFIVIALVQQPGLGLAMRQDWWVAVLSFAAGAVTVALPGRFPLLGAFVALVAFAALSGVTLFDAIAYILLVLGGFFFGLFVRALVYQRKHRTTSGGTSASTERHVDVENREQRD
jgi:hypothetical protein